ncbi:MAG: phosphate ABC transporter permease subunit PstC [Chloroflexi bacterium]|nr:phosphate ABC transporter permease subunit PstC [Chloroflexota bacterium]
MREKNEWRQRLNYRLQHGDLFWRMALLASSLLTVVVVLLIGWELWRGSALSRHEFAWAFVSPWAESTWNPALDRFQAWPSIYGSLITSLLALLLAVPFSIAVAIFLAELAPPYLRAPLNTMVEMLAAVPSVVYGLWGIYVFLPMVVAPLGKIIAGTLGAVPGLSVLFAGPMPPSGLSRLSAALILTFMVTPTITAVTRDVLLAIPRSQREASLALGATQWETIAQVLLPYGLSGILGAVILGFGRAIGETMAVTMVIGNTSGSGYSLLKPGYTMASIIANEFAEAVSDMHSSALIEIALVLFFITIILNAIARWLVASVNRKTMGR